VMTPTPPTSTPFPYTTLFRSGDRELRRRARQRGAVGHERVEAPAGRPDGRAGTDEHAVPGHGDAGPVALVLGWRHGSAALEVDGPRQLRLRRPLQHDRLDGAVQRLRPDRKSTRLNSSHVSISYAVFCLEKK